MVIDVDRTESKPTDSLQLPPMLFLLTYPPKHVRAGLPRAAVRCQNRPSQPADFSMAPIQNTLAARIADRPWSRPAGDLGRFHLAAAPSPPPPGTPLSTPGTQPYCRRWPPCPHRRPPGPHRRRRRDPAADPAAAAKRENPEMTMFVRGIQ